MHLLSEHGLKSLKNFIFIVLLEHVRELGNLFTLFAASHHLVTVDMEPHNLLIGSFGRRLVELYPTELVVTLLTLAVSFMRDDLSNQKWLAADVARNLVFAVYLHDQLGWVLHESVGAGRALVVVSLAAVGAKHQSTVWVLAFFRVVHYLLARATEEVFVELIDRRVAEPDNIEAQNLKHLLLPLN